MKHYLNSRGALQAVLSEAKKRKNGLDLDPLRGVWQHKVKYAAKNAIS